ncbi:hypothetical protein R6Q59_018224 [Mikania micrantha]
MQGRDARAIELQDAIEELKNIKDGGVVNKKFSSYVKFNYIGGNLFEPRHDDGLDCKPMVFIPCVATVIPYWTENNKISYSIKILQKKVICWGSLCANHSKPIDVAKVDSSIAVRPYPQISMAAITVANESKDKNLHLDCPAKIQIWSTNSDFGQTAYRHSLLLSKNHQQMTRDRQLSSMKPRSLMIL